MKKSTTTVMMSLIGTGAIFAASGAEASYIVGDPGAYDTSGISSLFEARTRLDAGNSQTWKNAFWQSGEHQPAATGGNFSSPWVSGQAQNFELAYHAGTGMAVWTVDMPGPIGPNMTMSSFQLGPDNLLAGFRFSARSEGNGSSTLLNDLELSINGGAYESILGLGSVESSGPDVFVDSDTVFFTEEITSLAIRGNVTFDWLEGTNLQGDRFRASVRLLEGQLIPAPGALALLGGALLCGVRRRRA